MKDMKPQDYLSNAIELKKNIDIIQTTFEKFGLEVLNVGLEFQDMFGGKGIKFYIEILGNENLESSEAYNVKVNVYDKDGGLIAMGSNPFRTDVFSGFDTIVVTVFNETIWQEAVKARVYLTKA